MANNFLNIDVDIKKSQKALEETNKSLKAISRLTLRTIAKGTVKTIKLSIKTSALKKRTGELLKCFGYSLAKNGKSATVRPKAINKEKRIFPKVMALSYGSLENKRNIKAYGFMQKGQDFVNSGQYKNDIEREIEKTLKKYWGE
ncbi:hypothetical protein [Treponema pectinovorum]|uniref:hypothetical protein n=1 Tax=Treponema pectinovorum TaxID=164 RepID=UPI0011CC8589|nr:hypothetical protein [Treponema pectinovorum]